ncbi:N-acetylmuramoyl-L-alanine amidase isoform X3 [Tympanuchus pallidicinctus]|uniref:N-acetylmuramoyl-L-alanine amidase isoform X3 n=1 Tax=Tympanuchus pallidicinctus TaxID=109042 RepID=UPI002287511C|nr:N-acetylmuramoyl-L-alanine amidase isoform X3 [Tympanuchus pallidicinctus]
MLCSAAAAVLLLLAVLSARTQAVSPPALLPRHISSLIPILQSLEVDDTQDIPSLVRALGGCGTPVCHTLLGDPPPTPKPIPELWTLLAHLLHPTTTAEHGLALAPDGSTVALAPLFAGIEVGLKRAAGGPGPIDQPDWAALDALYAVTIAEALGTSFLMARLNGTAALGPDGCWDDVDNPQNFTPSGPPSLVPDAVANGAMDGVLLGTRLAEEPIPLSVLFRRYYGVENGIIRGWPHSSRRRQDFGALTAVGKLEEEVVAMLRVLRGLSPTRELLEEFGEEEEAGIAHRAAREFMEVYVAPHAAPSPLAPATCAPCSSSTRTPVAGMTSATASWWVRMDTCTKAEVGTGWVPIPEVTTPRVTEWATWATSQPACQIPRPSLWCAMASYRVP